MVVLIGEQGVGKSQGIEKLVPEQSWYTDDLGGDLADRRAGEGLQGKWLVEFSEFARINRATLEMVKSYLSRRVDHYRPAISFCCSASKSSAGRSSICNGC
jgi:predicted P-loop ATPase